MKTQMDTLVNARIVDAPLDRVWRVWTQGARFAKWLAPTPETKAKLVVFDASPGGQWQVELHDPESGETYRGRGRFLHVAATSGLVLTWLWDHYGRESVVEVKLRAQGERTHVVISHSYIRDPTEHADLDAGWKDCLDRLAETAKAP